MNHTLGITILAFSFFLQSCMTKKVAHKNKIVPEQESVPKESTGCFVEFTDGTIRHFNSVRLVKGITTAPHLLADGRVKINSRNIKAYQNNLHYAISQKVYNPRRLSYVAVESLPGFAVQIAKGQLNIYVRKSFDSNKAVEEYFIQSGDGTITEYSYEAMMQVIGNHPEATEFFNGQKYKVARPILKRTADLFNGSSYTSR